MTQLLGKHGKVVIITKHCEMEENPEQTYQMQQKIGIVTRKEDIF